MFSPLAHRIPREFVHNLGRYLGMLFMMILAISLTNGFLVAASSIERIVADMPERYRTEDFYFTLDYEASPESLADVEAHGATVYETFYRDVPMELPETATYRENPIVCRVYKNRTEVNLAYYFEGREPASPDEIMLDRVFCSNHDLHVGDVVQVGGHELTLVGIGDLSDNTCLFEKNSDFMFNAQTFSVCQVVPELYEELVGDGATYRYAVVLDDGDMSLVDRTELEGEIARELVENGEDISELVDIDSNQGVTFASSDIEGDQVMWEILMMMLIVIMGFAFVVLTDANIEEESAVIGTLLASGYSKRELILHYLALPTIIGVLGTAVGTFVGTALLNPIMQGAYYGSYGLPPFELTFNPRVYVITSVIPPLVLIAITLFGLVRKLSLTPLQFLRHEVRSKSVTSGVQLPERWGFVRRFRLRVVLRNLSHFVTLFFGITFGSILLLMGLCLLPTVEHYAEESRQQMVSEHLYFLKAPLELDASDEQRELWDTVQRLEDMDGIDELQDALEAHDYALAQKIVDANDFDGLDLEGLQDLAEQANEFGEYGHPVAELENSPEAIAQAEPFLAVTLEAPRLWSDTNESVTVYGIQEDSLYWDELDVSGGRVVVGAGLAEKCGMEVGGVYSLVDRFTGRRYGICVDEIWGSSANMNVYMSIDKLGELLGYEPDATGSPYFNGYACDEELALDDEYLASELRPSEMSKMADQMQDSMGGIMQFIVYATIPIYFILIYLLTKTVIDRSARAIAYMKVFGYHAPEIDALYVRAITVTVITSIVLNVPLLLFLTGLLVKAMMSYYSGNISLYTDLPLMLKEIGIGVAAYAAVAVLHLAHVARVPLSIAMKVQE